MHPPRPLSPRLAHAAPRAWPLAVLLAALALPAAAQDNTTTHTLKQDRPSTGSHIPREVLSASLPLDKRYDELSPAQQAQVKAQYEQLPEGDEPPFPRDGLGKLYKSLHRAAEHLGGSGVVSMWVRVGPQGEAESVQVLAAPDPQVAEAMASLAMLTPFKPARCAGQPCTMDFPVRFRVALR